MMDVFVEASDFQTGCRYMKLNTRSFRKAGRIKSSIFQYKKFKCGTLNYKVEAREVRGCGGER